MQFEKTHLPCPCGESSDAYSSNTDGSGKCFSCGKFFPGTIDPAEVTFQYLPWRGVNVNTMARYKVSTSVTPDGEPIAIGFRYPNGGVKVRKLDSKHFTSKGDMKGPALFGSDVFQAGGPSIIITEGELDAMSAYQMTGMPAVSIKGASSALADVKANFDYLNAFDKVYLAFDNDAAGSEATRNVVPLFDSLKCYVLKLNLFKDANEYLERNADAFHIALKNAKRYIPDNILSNFNEIGEALTEKPAEAIGTYPFDALQSMTYGMRGGETVLIKALEGIGKTEIIRSVEAHLMQTTDHNIGLIHLEENKIRTIKGLASYVLNVPCHLPDAFVTPDEILEAYKQLVKRDERVHIYSHFGSDDPNSILNTIRFLVSACGCKFIFLDHISILVSGVESDDERQKLDYISTRLKMLAEELDFCLVFISHVNDFGQTRGSRNISKIADLIIKLDRDLTAATEAERNTTYLTVEKNRFAGNTGPAGKLFFDRSTYQVKEAA